MLPFPAALRHLGLSVAIGICCSGVSGAAASDGSLQPNDPETIADTQTDLAPGLRIVCQRMPPPPGSRIGGRNICQSQAEWIRYRREVKTLVQNFQDRSHF